MTPELEREAASICEAALDHGQSLTVAVNWAAGLNW